ncbi:group II intron reverse transcriptase/maturase [Candidatus Riflebacteria bacterium]
MRKNKGAPGCDGQTITKFDENRNRNLYKIWNRLSSGTYFPPPVRKKIIPKEDGSDRILGIPTVADRVAQGAVRYYMEDFLEPLFHEDSFGYRPGKSAHQALRICATRCWSYNWVLEIDISAFFDNVSHDLILKALEFHKMPAWVILYCKRWLQAPIVEKGFSQMQGIQARIKGTPQGGVISPLLANLFLHYAFDKWMEKNYNHIPFERYADDIVCHVKSMKETVWLKNILKRRFQEVGLMINEKKSNVVYIDTFKRWNVKTCFTFLGYDFKVRTLVDPKGTLFRRCMPGASKKAMKKISQIIKGWRIHRSTVEGPEEFARRHNPVLRGWIEYYGKFWYRNFSYHLWSVFQSRLLKWIKAKYRVPNKAAFHKITLMKRENPKLFAHWYLLRASNG